MFRLILVLALIPILSCCGTKGPLTLPAAGATPATAPTAPSAPPAKAKDSSKATTETPQ
jgi:predicted small lipoprotein YifL